VAGSGVTPGISLIDGLLQARDQRLSLEGHDIPTPTQTPESTSESAADAVTVPPTLRIEDDQEGRVVKPERMQVQVMCSVRDWRDVIGTCELEYVVAVGLCRSLSTTYVTCTGRAELLSFAARSTHELQISTQFFVSHAIVTPPDPPENVTIHSQRRLSIGDVVSAVDSGTEHSIIVVCGPPSYHRMIRKGLQKKPLPNVRVFEL